MGSPLRRPLVVANWKMNGSRAANAAWVAAFSTADVPCDVVVAAPSVYVAELAADFASTRIECGAQNLNEHQAGAYTGEVSAEMLSDVGCRWVIVGHSERRQLYGESNATVATKAARAMSTGLRPVVCVGETLEEREAGRTFQVIQAQLGAILEVLSVDELAQGALAYEPVWAIGTGRTATPEQAQEVHAALRAQLVERDAGAVMALRILYGGSVKPANAAELFARPDIDGGLIGGASLIATDFAAICAAAGGVAVR
jgi:triosephosphate isomerase (TIM)